MTNITDYFMLFFTQQLLAEIVAQTNLYATQKGANFFTVNQNDIQAFLGIFIAMGSIFANFTGI